MTTPPPAVTSSRGRKSPLARRIALACVLFAAFQAEGLPLQTSTKSEQQTSCTTEGYLRIALYAVGKQSKTPVSAILSDPQGRKIGYDPVSEMEFAEVPQATLSRDREEPKPVRRISPETGELEPLPSTPVSPPSPSQFILELCNPVGGQYQLRVMGTQQGKYGLSINAANREIVDVSGRLMSLDSRAEIPATNARKGAAQNFLVVYSRTPGVKVRLKAAAPQ